MGKPKIALDWTAFDLNLEAGSDQRRESSLHQGDKADSRVEPGSLREPDVMGSDLMEGRMAAEDDLDQLLEEFCLETGSTEMSARLQELAARLQLLVNEHEDDETRAVQPLQESADIQLSERSWRDYDLRTWNAQVYHS